MSSKDESKVWLRLANYSTIEINADGKFFQTFQIPKNYKAEKQLLRFGCNQLCGFKLKRVHLTCLHCRVRRVSEGKLPCSIPVSVHLFTICRSPTRRFGRVKDFLIKQLKSLIELLSD